MALLFWNLIFAAMLLALIGAGAAWLRPLLALREEPLTGAGGLALSAGTLGYVLFFFALFGWIGAGMNWSGPAWWLLPAVVWLVLLAVVRFAAGYGWLDSIRWRKPSWRMVPALVLLTWIVVSDLVLCFHPVFQDDAIQYHLTLPVHWLNSGALTPHPDIPMSGYPLLTEVLYTVPVTHRLPFATRILHVAFGAGIVFAIYGFLREQLSAAGALAFGAAFMVFETVNEIAVWANTDLARSFFLVVAAAFLARALEHRCRRDLVVGSIAGGLALSTHYMCLLFGNVAFSVAFGVTAFVGREKWKRILSGLALLWIISIIIMSPWLLKNVYFHGWFLQGVQNTSFRIPPVDVLAGFYLGSVYFVGFGAVALWLLVRRDSPADVRFLALYLLLYLLLGVFFIPNIMRFFFPVYAVGLMLAGRLAAPWLREKPWLEVAVPLVLLAMVAAVTAIYVWNGVYGEAIAFLFEGNPPYESVRWNAFR